MTRGIYVDPDTLFDVSRNISMTANEIDTVRHTIVTPIQEMINLIHPLGYIIPGAGFMIWEVQEGVNYFNGQLSLLTEEMRLASFGLNQIADDARVINDGLRWATTLLNTGVFTGIPSKPGNPSFGDISSTVLSTFGAGLDLLVKDTKWLSYVDEVVTVYGVATDIATQKNLDVRGVENAVAGGVVGNVVGITPWGRGAIIISGAIHLLGYAEGAAQDQVASGYTGEMGKQLKRPAEDLKMAADNANSGQVFDDMGILIVDTLAARVGFNKSFQGSAYVGSDLEKTFIDTAKLVASVPQFVVDSGVASIDDKLAGSNSVIQNLPLPSSFKGGWNTFTGGSINVLNNVADFITKGPSLPGNVQTTLNTVKNTAISLGSDFLTGGLMSW